MSHVTHPNVIADRSRALREGAFHISSTILRTFLHSGEGEEYDDGIPRRVNNSRQHAETSRYLTTLSLVLTRLLPTRRLSGKPTQTTLHFLLQWNLLVLM